MVPLRHLLNRPRRLHTNPLSLSLTLKRSNYNILPSIEREYT
jgi:hypothetical protein